MANVNFKLGQGVVAQNSSTFTSGSFSGVITSTVSNGTAPFTIASTTAVSNLQSQYATNLYAGATGSLPYQSAANTTTFLTLGTQNYFLVAGASAPTYVAPTVSTTYFASTTSAQLAAVISDETGSGALVFANTPTLVTPTLGVASATSINKVAITAPATSATLTIADGKTLTVSNTLTFTGTDTSSVAFGTGGTVAYTANKLSVFAATTSSELAGVISDETGSGALVFGTSPAITTSLTTASTTFSLINTNATTVNFAGAATTLSIGAGSGTTTVNNNLTVSGNLTVNGTTTTVNSTTVTVDDPIFVVGGDTAPSSDDNLDRGIEFRWHNGTSAKIGFFGYDDSTGYFTFVPDATDTASVISGSTGTFDGNLTGQAGSVANSQVIKFDTGTTEGTDLYTFNGSASKTIDIKAGSNITLTKTSGSITIAASGGFTNPMTTLGDIIYGGASGAGTRLAGNTTTTRKFLRQTGDGTNSAAPAWDTVTSTDVGLGNVENTALSTWAGSTNIVTVGAVSVDTGAKLDYNAQTISANTATTVHSQFASATYRTVKYMIQLTQSTKYRISEALVIHDGTTASVAEYGIIEVGGSMSGIAVDAIVTGGNIALQVTVTDAATTNVAAKVLGTAIVV